MKLNIKIGTLTLGVLLSFLTYSQQTPTFTEYNYNPFIINSAYAGATENPEFSINNTSSFNQFEGSPRNFSISGHGAVNRKKSRSWCWYNSR